jgi:hypothetical protein
VANGAAPDSVLRAEQSREITSYSVRASAEHLIIAWYWRLPDSRLDDSLNISALDRRTSRWTHTAVARMPGNAPANVSAQPLGSAVRITATPSHILLDTHVNPSAGTLLVLDAQLRMVRTLDGWSELVLPGGAVVYQKSMVHFAPTHPAELWIFGPSNGRNEALYPTQPYADVRRQYIERVRGIYARIGEDWFRINNHHMMAEQFESSIGDPMADSSGTRIAFIAMFGEGGGSRAATPLVEVLVVCGNVLVQPRCEETELSATRLANPDWTDERILREALSRGGEARRR